LSGGLRVTALLQRIVRSARRIVTSRIIAIVIMASELAVTLVAMGQPPVAHLWVHVVRGAGWERSGVLNGV
jgi:hypothetical protein